MKVLVIHTLPWNYTGMEKVIQNYHMAIDKEDLLFAYTHENAIPPDMKRNLEGAAFVTTPSRKKSLFRYCLFLWKLLKRVPFDVIHVHGNSATMGIEMVIGKFAGVQKRIAHCHNSSSHYPLAHRVLRPILNRGKTIGVASSKPAGLWCFGNQDFVVLPNGLDPRQYHFDEKVRVQVRKELGLEDAIVVGHVGLLNKQKNHLKLFKIFAQFKQGKTNAKLLLVSGDRVLTDELQSLAVELGIVQDIVFLSHRSDVPALIQTMDVFVFPSLFEGLGIVLLEVQALGVPCVVSEVVPPEVVISDGIEFLSLDLAESGWVEAMENSMMEMSKRPRRQDLLANSEYNIFEDAKRLRELYFS